MGDKKAIKTINKGLNSINRVKKYGIALAISILLLLIFSQTAYASLNVDTFDQKIFSYYIDAGTAGMIVRGLIGVAVAGLAMGAVFRRRITFWIKSKLKRSENSGDKEDTDDTLPTEAKDELAE
jgi:hypothetical protein